MAFRSIAMFVLMQRSWTIADSMQSKISELRADKNENDSLSYLVGGLILVVTCVKHSLLLQSKYVSSAITRGLANFGVSLCSEIIHIILMPIRGKITSLLSVFFL